MSSFVTHRFISSVAFDSMTNSELYHLFKDGRVASAFITNQLPKWFPSLGLRKSVEEGVAFTDSEGVRYIVRMATDGGLRFNKNSQNGVGRTVSFQENVKFLKNSVVIMVDIRNFPEIAFRLEGGLELLARYDKGHIPATELEEMFMEKETA